MLGDLPARQLTIVIMQTTERHELGRDNDIITGSSSVVTPHLGLSRTMATDAMATDVIRHQ